MKNPANKLRAAYYTLLSGIAPVYDMVLPFTTENTYIIISSETGKQERTKCRDLREHTLLIDIVTKFPAFQGNRSIADGLEEQVSELVNNGDKLDLGANFACLNVVEESSTDVTFDTPAETVIRKLIRYRHIIKLK